MQSVRQQPHYIEQYKRACSEAAMSPEEARNRVRDYKKEHPFLFILGKWDIWHFSAEIQAYNDLSKSI